jgi:serine/threonine protein kinase
MELPDQFCVEDFLGSGAYGTVCAVRIKTTSEVVAIKKCKKVFNSKTLAKRTMREIKLLRSIEHPHIVKMLSTLVPLNPHHFNDIYIIFEKMDTDLSQIVNSPQILTIEHVQYFLAQLCSALDYLHAGHVVHRDLK